MGLLGATFVRTLLDEQGPNRDAMLMSSRPAPSPFLLCSRAVFMAFSMCFEAFRVVFVMILATF